MCNVTARGRPIAAAREAAVHLSLMSDVYDGLRVWGVSYTSADSGRGADRGSSRLVGGPSGGGVPLPYG